jgi:hypothetical protein
LNNVTLVSDHVLLPHQADWSSRPRYGRVWRTAVDQTLAGTERRAGSRPSPWQQLEFSVLPFNHVERARFDDRFREAMKSGRIAVPFLGKGVRLASAAAASATSLTLTRRSDELVAGTYAFIQPQVPASFDTWDLLLLDAASGTALTLAEPLANGYSASTYVWPLLFGRPELRSMAPRNSARTRYEVSVLYDRHEVNPLADDGFETYEPGYTASADLDEGSGFDGAWVFGGIV